MKKFLSGIIIGALLMSAIPISAAIEEYILYKADYSLLINGTEYADTELPLLNYKGYTYAPVRSVFKAAGLNVEWNAELNQASVSAPTSTTEPTATGTPLTMLDVSPTPTPTTTPTPTPTATPTPIPEATPTPVIDYITAPHGSVVCAQVYNDIQMIVYFPEQMDAATSTDISNYMIYEPDGTTPAATQPTGAVYNPLEYAVYLDLSSAFDRSGIFLLEVSPTIKNADGTKFAKKSDGNPLDKIQFAAP
jgi:hypothetical protein